MLLAFAMAYGQDETTNWYFGRGAGLQFNNDGSVTPLTDGKISTEEGCASISDNSGELLFYTDGITVYNRNHEVMQNGQGLYGDPSSTQSAIIVPAPGSDTLFYIFTVDTSIREGDPNLGFNYSTVDISGNGGNGEVILKNSKLLSSCSEKITAVVKDCSDESVWVMTLATLDGTDGLSDTFHAFEVNSEGVNTNSIKSTFRTTFGDRRGNLKFSSNGEKMASANEFDGLYIYDFDSETGIVTNPEKINITAPYANPYSVEFSPSNQYLYVHSHSDAPALEIGHNSNLLQFDLLTENISGSEIIIDQKNIYRGALQLAANGKIYRTITNNYLQGTQYLGVINNPNQKGHAANYEHDAVFLEGGIAMQGLPPFIQSFFAKKGLIKTADGSTTTSATFCDGDEVTLEAEDIPGSIYQWEYEGAPIDNPERYILRIPDVNMDNVGQYRLTIIPTDPTQCEILGEAQIQVNELPLANNYNLMQCDIDEGGQTASSDGYTVFNLDQARKEINSSNENSIFFYRTLADQQNDVPIENTAEYINETAVSQTVFVKVTDRNGCSNEAELILEVSSSPSNLSTGVIYYSCAIDPNNSESEGIFDLGLIKEENYQNLEVVFYNSKRDAALEINPIQENGYSTVSTNIYARIETMNQCLGVEEIELIVNPTPIVNIESEYIVCTNHPNLQIYAEDGFDTYTWSKLGNDNSKVIISNEKSVDILEPGEYQLELGWHYDDGNEICTNSASFRVMPSNNAVISNIEVEDLQENNKITIMAIGDGDYEYAIGDSNGPYQDSPILENVSPGQMTIFVRDKNGCGITDEEVSVIGFPRFFTPNGDGINESWNLIGVSDDSKIAVSIFDRYGKLVYEVRPTDQNGWNGMSNGKSLPASDYWFKIQMEEGRVYKGHFTLKR